MKGIIGNKEGILVPYQEFCKKVIPKGYILMWFHCNNEYINFSLVKEFSFKIKGDLMYDYGAEEYLTLLKKKTEVFKLLGIKPEEFNHLQMFQLGNAGKLAKIMRVGIKFAIANKEKNFYIWIEKGQHSYIYDGFFVKTSNDKKTIPVKNKNLRGMLKGIVKDVSGVLIPYKEFCKKINMPKGYAISWCECIGYSGDYVQIKLNKDLATVGLKEDVIIYKDDEEVELTIRKKKTKLLKEIGIKFKSKEISDLRVYQLKDDNKVFEIGWDEVEFVLKNNKNKLFVWIEEGVPALYSEEEYFVETK